MSKTTAKSGLKSGKKRANDMRGCKQPVTAAIKNAEVIDNDEKEGRLVRVDSKLLHKYKFEKCHRCGHPLVWEDWRGNWITPETFVARGYNCDTCNKTYANKEHIGGLSRFDVTELRAIRPEMN